MGESRQTVSKNDGMFYSEAKILSLLKDKKVNTITHTQKTELIQELHEGANEGQQKIPIVYLRLM